jgi:hypothetical protein
VLQKANSEIFEELRLLSHPEELADIYETVKVLLILIARFLFQALMLLERLIVRCALLFGVNRRWNFVPAIFSKRNGGCAHYNNVSMFPEFRKRDTQAARKKEATDNHGSAKSRRLHRGGAEGAGLRFL